MARVPDQVRVEKLKVFGTHEDLGVGFHLYSPRTFQNIVVCLLLL